MSLADRLAAAELRAYQRGRDRRDAGRPSALHRMLIWLTGLTDRTWRTP